MQQAFFVLHIRSGGDYDPSKSGNNMRVASWVSPIYARLQRRFPKFSPQDIEERHKPMVTDAFMKLLRRLPMEVQPKYTLYGSGADGNAEYPPWQLADLHLRAIRNSISPDDPLTTLETRVSQLFRDDMSKKVQANLKPLSAMRSQLIRELAPAQKEVVEKMLNVGHETVAAVLLVWHIQHNIVGVQQQVASTTNTNNNNNKNSEVMEYVHPLPSIRNSSQVLQGMSKKNREDAIFTLRNALVPYGKNVPDSLKAAALLAYNTRNTASEQYRALSIYNMDLEKSSVNRDGVYIAVLKEVIASALQNKQETFVKETFYEQLVAMSTLEEVIGCREPRASCEEAYLSAVASTILRSIGSNPTGVMSELESMKQRSKDIKIALHLILRLTDETKESDMHKTAFKMAIRKLATEFEEGRRKGLMLFVQPHYEWICNMLDIDEAWAKDYVQTLCITKFDKAISNLLMNADLAISMPDMLPMFEKQLADLGQEVLITPDEAGERVVFLAGLTLYSLLDTALEEFQKSNINRVDIVFKKLYNAFQHPLMKALQAKDSSRDITEVGLVYLLRQDRGLEYVMEVIRMLDALRQRSMSGSGGVNPSAGSNMPSSGWGGAAASSNVAIEAFAQQNQEAKEGMTAFLTKLQSYLLKEFAAGNAR